MSTQTFWNLQLLMAQRGIRTATELARQLKEQGYPITATYAAKIRRDPPREIRADLLRALVKVLGCSYDQLLCPPDTVCDQKTTLATEIQPLTGNPEAAGDSEPQQREEPASRQTAALPEALRMMPPVRLLGRQGTSERSGS